MGQFHFDPDNYAQLMAEEVPAYPRLQDAVRAAAAGADGVERVLDLGTGTGVTAAAVLAEYPDARLVGIDASVKMLRHARAALPEGTVLWVGRLQGRLPEGPFDLAVSALAVHHLDGDEKAALFRRVAAGLAPGGRFVLGDIVIPVDPADVVTPIDGDYDKPSAAADQVRWLTEAGFRVETAWAERDLIVLVGELAG
ncbi:class I SAM-dependent methyltransferase [Nocardia pseudobrasiliensis]|uniref:Methyltransferase family protein n=1 Tax=Nocardia pseudobrasiliensis TaxID=45979 RepID=A0A370IE09_9NOCA|nr:class I SAM-dependent methyltransferase [Nocardia pseudobrasiliensis]RDI68943.1 methyltransferase family protein [Nocardia pseudobrasiliensis]